MITHHSSPLSSWQPVQEIIRFELQESIRTRFLPLSCGFFLILTLLIMHINGSDLFFFPAFREIMGQNPRPGEMVFYANAPLKIMRIFQFANLFLILLSVGIFTERATKDFTSNMDGLLFTSPLKEWQFGAGRFIASFLISVFISLSLGLGLLVAQGLPWMSPARMAPFNLLAYIQPYIYLIIPNILIFGLFSFALGLLTRRSLTSYLGLVGILLLQIILEAILGIFRATPFLNSLVNPLGTVQIDYTVRFWTKVEQNTLNIPFDPVIWLSRLLFLGLSVAFFVWVWQRFSFSGSSTRSPGRLAQLMDSIEQRLMFRKTNSDQELETVARQREGLLQSVPTPHLHYGIDAQLSHVWRIAQLELKRLISNPLTLAILAISLMTTGFLIVMVVSSGGVIPMLPVTELVVDGLTMLLRFFAPLLIVFLAGDLVWREREVRIDPLIDSLPTRSWAFVGGKLLALAMLLFLTLVLLVLGAMLAQTVNGYTHYNLGVYGVGLFTIALVDLLLIAVLAITVQVLVNQKFIGYFLSAALVMVLAAGDLVFRKARLLQYGFRPKVYYSDLGGYGSMLEPVRWFQGYWLAIALLLFCICALFWVRGVETQPKQRWRIARQRFTRPMQMVIGFGVVTAILLGGSIYYNTRMVNGGSSLNAAMSQLIAYEKAYASLRDAQPKIIAINLQGDLYPETDSRFAVKGTYTLQNQTKQPIEQILVNIPKSVEVNQVTVNGISGEQAVQHPGLRVYNFPLTSPLLPGATLEASFDILRKPPADFAEDPGRTFSHYLANGASFLSTDFLPQIGFNDRILARDPQMRQQAGLAPLDPASEKERASQSNWNHPDTDLALFSATLSTASDQSIFTSGEKVREWREGDRHYFQYQSQIPIQKMIPFVSGRYEVLRDQWQNIPIEIYYHQDHDHNLQSILKGVQKGLDYASQQFGPYPYKSLRIVETPFENVAISYTGGQINMGERLAFLTKIDDNNPNIVNSAFRFAAHEVAHQWWGHQVIPSRLEGSKILTESLSEYTANQVYAQEFGKKGLGIALRDNLNTYLQNRSRSDLPLVEAEENHLVYQKGSLAMFALQDYLGEELVNRTLAQFLRDHATVPPYPTGTDLVAVLRQITPEKYQYLITDLFETVTLYDNQTTAASFIQRPDGKYDVTLTVKMAKVRSDKVGNETPTEMNNEEIDVGVYDANDQLIYLAKHPFSKDTTELTITVDQLPQKVGIDPLNKLIDKVPVDNVVFVVAMENKYLPENKKDSSSGQK